MSGGISNGAMTLQDFMRLYQPTQLPVVQPQSVPMAPLGASQAPAQGGGQPGGGQGQQGGSLPFLGQLAQLGGNMVQRPAGGQAQPGQTAPAYPQGIQGVIMKAMDANGANGSSNALANAVGFQPFGGGGFGG